MLAFCRVMPIVCRTSTVNRASLRDEGFVAAAVELLREATLAGNEVETVLAAVALSNTCTANDGNKKAAAQLPECAQSPETALFPGVAGSPTAAVWEPGTSQKLGGMQILLEALGRFPESLAVQTEAVAAFRTLVTDDDPRKAECEPAAVENREVALSDAGFPFVATAIERALGLVKASEKLPVKLLEQTLLLLREVARRQDLIQMLAIDTKYLTLVQEMSLQSADARIVRAGLSVLRAFVVDDAVRDDFGLMGDGPQQCLAAVKNHIGTPAVCEQGFGLFANLTLRKSSIAASLNAGAPGIVAMAGVVLVKHRERADVMRSVVQAVRNVAAQDESASKEVAASDIFEEVRGIVKRHEGGEARWRAAVDVARQFLREFRQDEGMEKASQYNKYY